jgi:ferredoxin
MKLAIDSARCMGHGRCYSVAPDLLTFDDDGYVASRGELVDVPENHVEAARQAVANCPERAVELIDD